MLEDAELLRRYAANGTERDFAELVRRHVNLVYSAALRQVHGDAHLAQDVTQIVFTDLARKAASVAPHRVLAGWLFTSARFAAAKAVRGERRRHAREAEAHLMEELNRDPTAQLDWARVRPVLDGVLGELAEPDREAILLRFFEGRDFAGVGEKLNMNDNTARMRVERALDKLRALLERRGVTSTSAALAAALANQAVVAAPAGLAAVVTGAALAGAGAAAGGGAWAGGAAAATATFMSMTKLQVGIGSALAVAGATGMALQAWTNAELRDEVASLRQQNTAIAPLRAANAQLKRAAVEVADLRNDDAELKRLNDEAAALKARMQQVARAQAAAGGEVYELSKLDRVPRARFQARPQYPAEMRRAGVAGEVVVDFIVDKDGNVQNAYAARSLSLPRETKAAAVEDFVVAARGEVQNTSAAKSSQREFEAAAVEAVSKWKFDSGLKGGRAVNTHMQVPIVFTLSKNEGTPGTPEPKAGPPKP
ncbi:MAG: TonB family protein [Verrucomicrobia bacterium]|nr:TonB family protein [Verrucomicrobiota bacterium]